MFYWLGAAKVLKSLVACLFVQLSKIVTAREENLMKKEYL